MTDMFGGGGISDRRPPARHRPAPPARGLPGRVGGRGSDARHRHADDLSLPPARPGDRGGARSRAVQRHAGDHRSRRTVFAHGARRCPWRAAAAGRPRRQAGARGATSSATGCATRSTRGSRPTALPAPSPAPTPRRRATRRTCRSRSAGSGRSSAWAARSPRRSVASTSRSGPARPSPRGEPAARIAGDEILQRGEDMAAVGCPACRTCAAGGSPACSKTRRRR